jgi:hypothetical protein
MAGECFDFIEGFNAINFRGVNIPREKSDGSDNNVPPGIILFPEV